MGSDAARVPLLFSIEGYIRETTSEGDSGKISPSISPGEMRVEVKDIYIYKGS